MLASEARVATAMPRRYLGQLCKHFGHKVPVAGDERTGRIEFPFAVCDLAAPDEEALVMRISAEDEERLAQAEGVVARHLERFAFREALEIVWRRG